jgi:hypothetical protein
LTLLVFAALVNAISFKTPAWALSIQNIKIFVSNIKKLTI